VATVKLMADTESDQTKGDLMSRESLKEKLDKEVQEFQNVVQEVEQLAAKREQIRGRVQVLEQLIQEENEPETVSGEVVN
jgi:hypothetical protein